jgi:uncharacterized protein (DUF2252 family)
VKRKRVWPKSALARQKALNARRRLKMARSPHAFMRGRADLFYDGLARSNVAAPSGPTLWICGDCHLGNLGPVGDTEGKTAIEIRDFDHGAQSNPAYDLMRLGLSLATAARGSDLPGVVTAQMMECLVDGYERAFAPEPVETPPSVRLTLKRARGRRWRHLLKGKLDPCGASLPLGKRFWPLTRSERDRVETLLSSPDIRRLATALKSRDDDAKVSFLDAAHWVKGCSSLGRLRIAVLVAINGGGRPRDLCLLDIKEAVEPLAPIKGEVAGNGARVLAAARALSPGLGQRIIAARLFDRDVFVREMMPQDFRFGIDHLSASEAGALAAYLGWVVGRAHARQLDDGDKRAWTQELARNRGGGLDAPSWLWRAVVASMATHEAAYLEHCRAYALEHASAPRH